MAKDNVEGAPKKKGKFKKLLLIGVAAIALIGAGAGAGIYFGALQAHEAKPEDKYPKLVLRSDDDRSEEHTSELQSLMRISYAVFCLKKKKTDKQISN